MKRPDAPAEIELAIASARTTLQRLGGRTSDPELAALLGEAAARAEQLLTDLERLRAIALRPPSSSSN